MSPAKALRKLAMAERRVKILDAGGHESKLQRISAERKCRALKTKAAALRSKLQTALSRVLELVIHLGQRVVVDPSAESETIVALKALLAALWNHMKTIKDEDGNQA